MREKRLQQGRRGRAHHRFALSAVALGVAATGFTLPAAAMILETDNPDLQMRFDTSVRYNAGWRMEDINPAFGNSPATDATEYFARKHDMVVNRLDLLGDFDFVYKGDRGFRISAAAWRDFAVGSGPERNPALSAFPQEYRGGVYNPYARRFARGPSGEILDAFVFGSFNAGTVPVNVKLGKHVTYWGEGLFNLFHSISYSQAPLNLQKATASPGIEAKEVFMPIAQVSAQAQLAETLSLGAQVMLDWKPSRLPPGGTYFAAADATRADQVAAAPGFAFPVGADVEPSRKRGQFGVNMRWSPKWLDGTAGVYYRRFNEVMPWAQLSISPTGVPRNLHLAFAQDTELLGFSLTKTLAGASVGAEASFRHNTALNSTTNPAGLAALNYQGLEGARGDTFHFLLNGIYLLPRTALFEGGALQAELSYANLRKVTKNANVFLGEGTANCPAGVPATEANCATKSFVGLQIGGNFDYPQVFPGVNLSVPFSYSVGLKGNAANLGGGNEGAKTWSIGLTAKFREVHEFSLKYNDSKVRYTTNPATGLALRQNGSTAVANNHGWLSFTYKTAF